MGLYSGREYSMGGSALVMDRCIAKLTYQTSCLTERKLALGCTAEHDISGVGTLSKLVQIMLVMVIEK